MGYGVTVGRLIDLIEVAIIKKTIWESWPKRVKAPYRKIIVNCICYILSRFGHEKSGLNKGGPPSKAK